MIHSQRIAIYFLSFVLPPITVGMTLALMSMSELMIHKEPAPLADSEIQAQAQTLRTDAKSLHALILLGTSGTELTELMAPFEILSQSGSITVSTVSVHRKLLPTTAEVSVLPDYSFDNAPEAQILVLPSILENDEKAVIDFIRKKSQNARYVLVLGEGARLAAKAGLLEGKSATTHFIALKKLKASFPGTRWIWGPAALSDGQIITSQGISRSMDASILLLQKLLAPPKFQQLIRSLSLTNLLPSNQNLPEPSLLPQEVLNLLLHAGYDWNKPTIGVYLYPGVSEIGVAALMDSLPRTQNLKLFSLADERKIIRTRNGLALVPTEGISDSIHADAVVIPSGSFPSSVADSKMFKNWRERGDLQLLDFQELAVGQTFPKALSWISDLEGERSMSHLVGKFLELPETESAPSVTSLLRNVLWFRPILVGLIGLVLCFFILRRKDAAKALRIS